MVDVRKYKASAVKLYNNNLKSIAGLAGVLDEVLVKGSAEVYWLDISFNKLRRIEDVYYFVSIYIFIYI